MAESFRRCVPLKAPASPLHRGNFRSMLRAHWLKRICSLRKFSTILLKTMWKRVLRASKPSINTALYALCTYCVHLCRRQEDGPAEQLARPVHSELRKLPGRKSSRGGALREASVPMRRRFERDLNRFLTLLDVVPFAERVPALSDHLNQNLTLRDLGDLHGAVLVGLEVQLG